MSWIKNQLNKLLSKGEEEQYEEYEEQEPYSEQTRQNDQRASTQAQERKTSFRFPLIADDEPNQQPSQPTYDEGPVRPAEKAFQLPRHLQQQQQPQAVDVEVSGIRDLLERRQNGRGQSNVIRSREDNERSSLVTREEREVLMTNPVRPERPVDQKFVNPVENRKRFVPTEVPSPVHGYKPQTPTPIEKLLKQKPNAVRAEEPKTSGLDEKQVTPINVKPLQVQEDELASTVVENKVVPIVPIQPEMKAVQTPPSLETNDVLEALVIEEDEQPVLLHVEEPPPIHLMLDEASVVPQPEAIMKEEPVEELPVEPTAITPEEVQSVTEPVAEPVQVQHVTIENSTIHIEQLHVEQMPQELPQALESQEQKVEQQKSEGTRLPFNVLMLKTDRQKLLAQQIAKEQFRKVKPTTPSTEEQVEELNLPLVAEQAVMAEPVEEEVVALQPEAVLAVEDTATIYVNEVVTDVVQQQVTVALEGESTKVEDVVTEAVVEVEDVPTIYVDEVVTDVVQQSVEVEHVVEVVQELVSDEPEATVAEPVQVQQVLFEDARLPVVEQIEPIVTQPENAVEAEVVQVEPEKKRAPYHKPPMDYLLPPEEELEDREWMEEQGEHLVEALSHFQIAAQIESIVQGPAVTQFEITVGHGTKVSKVRNLSDDIKLALAAKDVRIDAPIPGKRSIGIEIPNRISRAVRLSEVTNSDSFKESDSPLEAALGLDLTGKPVTLDLRKMPHGLVAGATGSGKSVCINSILVSLLYKADPSELKLLLIDPKMVELAPFNHIPHLVSPVITDVKAATAALKWAVEEMERRYQLFMHSGQRHITAYNKLCDKNKQYAQKLPYILIVIDELADLMMMAPQDVEDAICRIAQKARACGIHLIIATQRPSVDVITGLIKSNIPTRIAFAVSSQIDSRTIIDGVGAERLLGRGDMLYMGNGMSAPIRIQGTFVTDEEIEEIIEYVREQGEPEYLFEQEELLKKAEAVEEQDELFEEVCRYVFEHGSASTSAIQRRYHIGYNRAARLVDMLERHRFVSEQKGSKPRDVFITETDLAHHFGG